ncbi:MAG: hypothetical protein GX137_06155 [Thermoplasmatales archaeon]|nr:hypothetical protein [Thermoplasmatales archaeon]
MQELDDAIRHVVQLDEELVKGIFEIYKNHFIPAYSDLVVITINKPSVVLLEIEATYTHLMKCLMNEDVDLNLKKAKGHLYRASVDCYKLLWENIYDVVTKVDEYRSSYEGKESELLNKLKEMNRYMVDARRTEVSEVGTEDLEILSAWKEALTLGLDIFYSVNKAEMKKQMKRSRYSGPFSTYIYPIILGALFLGLGIIIGKFL